MCAIRGVQSAPTWRCARLAGDGAPEARSSQTHLRTQPYTAPGAGCGSTDHSCHQLPVHWRKAATVLPLRWARPYPPARQPRAVEVLLVPRLQLDYAGYASTRDDWTDTSAGDKASVAEKEETSIDQDAQGPASVNKHSTVRRPVPHPRVAITSLSSTNLALRPWKSTSAPP